MSGHAQHDDQFAGNASNERKNTAFKAFTTDLVAGGVSGIVAKTVAAPLDRIKLTMQTQGINTIGKPLYSSSWTCAVGVVRSEGVLSLWRGNVANVYRYFPSQAFNFAFKDQFKQVFVPAAVRTDDKFGHVKIAAGNFVAGGCAGAASLVLCYPFDLARTRLATDAGVDKSRHHTSSLEISRKYKGTWDCLSQALRNQGIRGLYDGLSVSLVGAVVFRALFMGGYDFSKYYFNLDLGKKGGQHESNLLLRIAAAQVVSTVVGGICYPLDTVKRRMMVQGEALFNSRGTKQLVYTSSWNCFTSIVRKEGPRALFSGFTANLLRSFTGPILLVGYDELKRLLSET